MKQTSRWLAALLAALMLIAAIGGCGGDTTPTTAPTTTAPTTTTPTTTPSTPATPTAPATPEPAEPTLPAFIFGQDVKIGVDADGAFREDYTITTPDGSASVLFKTGTKLVDGDGNLIPELTVNLNENPDQPEDGSKILGPTLTFYPDLTDISPALEYSFNYAAFSAEIAAIPDAEVNVSRFVSSRGRWAAIYDAVTDSAAQTASTQINDFTVDYTIGVIAAPPKQIVRAEGPPANGVDIVIQDPREYAADAPGTLTVKTVPNAYVVCWMVNPGTGSRSSRPDDRFRQADSDGLITWEFTISRHVSKGEGHFEFYVTTNDDADFLEVFQATRLDTLFPDRAEELENFQQGLIEQIELDAQTTLKMYSYVISLGREDLSDATETTEAPPTSEPTADAGAGDVPLAIDFITPYIETEKEIVITVKTTPGATVFIQPINPGTGTRSSWPKPADGGKVKTAGEDGLVSYSWTLFRAVGEGDGILEFLVTTSTDAEYLATWKESMATATKKQLAESRDDTAYYELTWTVDKSNY